MGILNNNMIKYAFDSNTKGKNDLEEYKKLLFKYKQVLDWYRQDLQDYNYMFLTRDDNGNIQLNESKLHFPAEEKTTVEEKTEPLFSLNDIRSALRNELEETLQENPLSQEKDFTDILKEINYLSEKLEKIDNSLSDFVYGEPSYPDYEGEFEHLSQSIQEIDSHISSLDNTMNHSVSQEIENQISSLDNSISQKIGNQISSLDSTISQEIENQISSLDNSISQKIGNQISSLNHSIIQGVGSQISSLDNAVHAGFELLNSKQEEPAASDNSEEILSKVKDLNQKLIHMNTDLQSNMDEKLTKKIDTLERKLDIVSQDSSFAHRKLVLLLSISTILNVIAFGLLFCFLLTL